MKDQPERPGSTHPAPDQMCVKVEQMPSECDTFRAVVNAAVAENTGDLMDLPATEAAVERMNDSDARNEGQPRTRLWSPGRGGSERTYSRTEGTEGDASHFRDSKGAAGAIPTPVPWPHTDRGSQSISSARRSAGFPIP